MTPSWTVDSSLQFSQKIRQIITLLLSIICIFMMLLIPLSLIPEKTNQDSPISIRLTKPLQTQEKIEETSTSKPPITNDTAHSPMNENTHTTPMKPPTTTVKKIKPAVEETTTSTVNKTTQTKKTMVVMPSAGDILNSIESIEKFEPMDEAFTAIEKNPDEFIMKPIIAPDTPKLIVNEKYVNVTAGEYTPLTMKALKSLTGFMMPIPDREKTQDTLSYCHTLGRHSVHCPTSNPLLD